MPGQKNQRSSGHGSQEGDASEDARAQDNDELDDASLAGSHDEPPEMIDSGEDEEIELLLGGVIPSADDDIDGFARHRNRGDLEAVYSREFVDSKFEAPTMRHLATREPKLRSCDACRRAKAMRARRIGTSKNARSRVRKSQGQIPEHFGDQVALDHIIARSERNLGFAKQTNAFTLADRATDFRWGFVFRKSPARPTWRWCESFRGQTPRTRLCTSMPMQRPRSVKHCESAVPMTRRRQAIRRAME
jgi:hypothetical protein